jgi:class 3 adenylate cyclase/tetratricopeptide (TPR) repeat protein
MESTKMQCPKCQFENREGAKFCGECGYKFEVTCLECGANNRAGNKFCDECGHDLRKAKETPPIVYSEPQSYTPKFLADKILTSRSSIEGERKLVTVLFTDVANYTVMSEKLDPEEVHQIMDDCFRILMEEIHRYEGTINQFTGDGVMALFGAPIAHEDHAQRACRAGIGIQKALQSYGEKIKEKFGIEFKMRIGLNSGPVVVGTIGDDLRMDYTADGDTTNMASRMEGLAKPGTIMAASHTYELARDFFEFKRLGRHRVKGKKEAQQVYELLRATKVETRIEAAIARGLAKFVGRSKEIDALKGAYAKARSGYGQVVGIVGEAGVGKSRLLIELRNFLPKDEYTYLEGRCLHYGASMSYLPILDILRSYFEIEDGDEELVVKKKIEDKTLSLDERLKSALPPFQVLFSLQVDDKAYLQLDPSVKKIRSFEAIRDLVVRESENKTLVIAVEDLHWNDSISEEFLSYLIDSLSNTRILLILLYRPEYTHQWGSKSHYSKIGVNQLPAASSAELVRAILEDGEVVPELIDLVLGKAGGNPLFMEELTLNLLENGSIQKKDNRYVLGSEFSEIGVPDTIHGIMAARIDRVDENLKRTMQIASVIGREFVFRILQTIMGMKEELKSHLLNLQGLEFISEKRLFPELEYIFKHALTQEVAYNSLLHKRRREIHEDIGRAIENLYPKRLEEYYELLAYHYSRSENAEKAVHYLDLANQKAIKTNAVEQAKQFFDDAMKLLDTLPETEDYQRRRISLLINQLLVMFLLFKYPEYHDLLTRFEHLAVGLEDKGLLGAFYSRLGTCEWGYGNFDLAIQLDTKAAELCETAGDVEEAAYAYAQLQWCHQYKSNYDQVLLLKERVLRAMEDRFNLRTYSWAIQAAACAYKGLGRWDEAEAEGQQLLKIAEEFSDDGVTSFAASILSFAYNFKGDSAKAIEYGELAVRKATTPGDKVWAESMLAGARCRAGEIRKGVEFLADIVPLMRAVSFFPGEFFTVCLGEGYFLAGEYDKATQTLEEFLEIAQGREMKWEIGTAHRFLGEVALKTEPAQAATHFEKSIAMFEEINATNDLALAYAGYGRYYKQLGVMAKAREYLTQALEIFERLGTLIEPDKVKKELAGLPKD